MTQGVNQLRGVPQGVVHVKEESTDLQAVIDASVKERLELNRKTKLTWDPQKLPIAGDAKMVGKELSLSLPFMLVDKKYYIQNMRIYMLNGEETTLRDVQEMENPLVFAHVKEAYDNMSEQALASDPNLCKYCWIVTADTAQAFMTHMVQKHPDIVMKIAQGEPDVKPTYVCERCTANFPNAERLRMHSATHKRLGRPPKPKTETVEPPSLRQDELQPESESDQDAEL